MRQFSAPAMLLCLLLTALLLWFADSVASHINSWLDINDHLAAWAQAVGGVLAVLAAWAIGRHQVQTALAVERERQRQQHLKYLNAAYLIFSEAIADIDQMAKINILSGAGPGELVRVAEDVANSVDQTLISYLPPVVYANLSSLRAVLKAFIAAIKRRTLFTQVEVSIVAEDLARHRELALCGQTLTWDLIKITSTAAELAQELAMRNRYQELRNGPKEGNPH